MKIFALYFRINLSQKPNWFDEFRKKNDGWFELHITLIQPRYINDKKIDDLKLKVEKILTQHKLEEKNKKLIFNKPKLEELQDGKYIFMWFTEGNTWLIEFQNKLKIELENYNKYVDEITKEYEKNFDPHITVVESIDLAQKNDVEEKLLENSILEGELVDLVLPTVNNTSREERENKDNLHVFKL